MKPLYAALLFAVLFPVWMLAAVAGAAWALAIAGFVMGRDFVLEIARAVVDEHGLEP